MATLAIYIAMGRYGIFTGHGVFISSNSHICAEEYFHGAQFRHKQLQFVVNTWADVENIA
jgi:pyridoxal biosynthesis lyase PdxS